MKKHLLWLLLLTALILCGCAAQGPQQPAVTETPLPLVTAAPVARGPLAEAVQALMAPYQASLAAAAQKPGALTWSIPGDMLEKMAEDAQAVGAAAQDGRYRFTWHQAGEHTYSASALEIADLAPTDATPDPQSEADPVMDNQQMGDFSAAGGGVFDRTCAYDAEEHLNDGTVEITELLNGEITGHELFSFVKKGDDLYFVDGILDLTAGLDGLEPTEQYLVAAGVLRREGLDIIEFVVPGKDQVPQAAALDLNALLSSVRPLSRVTVP